MIGKVTQGAASFAGGFIEGTTKAVANELVFDGAGRLVPKFGQSLAALAPVEYVCHACDCLFKTTFYTDGNIKEIALKKLPMPENIIRQIRDGYIEGIRKKRPYISTVIFSLLAIYGYIYFFIGLVNDSFFGGAFQIVFGLIWGTGFLIPSIFKIRKIVSINKEVEQCEGLSLREFKQTHRDLFSDYPQYN